MNMKVIICETNGKQEIKEIESIDTIRDLIDGWIEIVHPKGLPHPYLMIVDEEGLLKDLPANPIGSILYDETCRYPIVGTVIIAKEGIVDGEPDIVGLTDAEATYLYEWHIPKILVRIFRPIFETNN